MKKMRQLVSGIIIMFFFAALAARGVNKPHSWYVALSGGGNFGQNGDAGKFIGEYDRFYRAVAEAYGNSFSGSLTWPGTGMEFGGEIGYSFSSRLSAGLAVERLSKNMKEESITLGSAGGGYMAGTTHFMEMNMSALSISVVGRYSIPLTQAVSIVSRAGFGVLFGSWDRVLMRRFPNISDEWTLTGEYTASGLTGQAGLGLTWDLTPQIALLLEGGYRLASRSNWKGTNSYAQGPESEDATGDLKYWEMQGDGRIPTIHHPSLSTTNPNLDPAVVSSRACLAGFSGFSLKAGIVVRFGR